MRDENDITLDQCRECGAELTTRRGGYLYRAAERDLADETLCESCGWKMRSGEMCDVAAALAASARAGKEQP